MKGVFFDFRMSALRRIAAVGVIAGLGACGGGGTSSNDAPPGGGGTGPGETPPTAQGSWTGRDASTSPVTQFTVLVVPDLSAASTSQTWAVIEKAVTETSDPVPKFAKLSISSANVLSGKLFTLGTLTPPEALTGTATVSGTADNPSLSFSGLGAGALNLTRTDALTGATPKTDYLGQWTGKAKKNGFQATATWTIESVPEGLRLSGSSDANCKYTGTFVPRLDSPIADGQFTETCDQNNTLVKTEFTGIARLMSSKGQLTFLAVSTTGDQPWLLPMTSSNPR